MGNNLTQSHQPSMLEEIGRNYTQIKREARGVVLMHKQTELTYLLKEYTFGSEVTYQSKLKMLEKEVQEGAKEYIVSPVRVQSKVFNNFCSTSFKIYAIFEYPQVTLKEEILARCKQNKNFEETELWSILQSCTNALSELKPLVTLNSKEIFINPDGHLKIIHNDLIDENYRAIITHDINYAPEKLKNFNRIDTDLAMRKEAIFSMGITILEAAQLAEASGCYDYAQGVFNEGELNEMVEAISQKYSPQFYEILSNILEVNPNRRASLMEVQKILDCYWGGQSCQSSRAKVQKSKQIPVENVREGERQSTLCEKNANRVEYSQKKSQKKELTLPDQISSYKLQKPTSHQPIMDSLITPKNPPAKENNGIYTDPRLLQMIRKDLEDINKLKQSAFYETGKYSYGYPQTESIMNSITNYEKDIHTHEPKMRSSHFNVTQEVNSVRSSQQVMEFKQLKMHQYQSNKNTAPTSHQITDRDNQPATKPMMKKNNKEQTVFTIQTYENGRRFEGMTFNGKKHGHGKLVFEDQAYYQGEFRDDKMTGKGILYYCVGYPAYDGEWLNDQFHGHGILYNQNPVQLQQPYDFRDFNEVDDYWVKYQGDFVLDNKCGQGKLLLTNGETLQGEFRDDFIEGSGRFFTMEGQVIAGIWQKNMLTSIMGEQY